MGAPDDSKYYVIRAPRIHTLQGIKEYVCVPRTWIVARTGDHVVVSYPLENPTVTENRVKDGEGISKEWKTYTSVVRCGFNSYYPAKYVTAKINYQQNVCSNMTSEGNKSGGSVQKRTRRSEHFNSNQNLDKPLEFGVSSKNDDRSATKLKQTPQSNPKTKAVSKQSKVADPAESDSEDTEQSCQGNENSSLEPITIADPELFTVMLTRLRDLHKSSKTNRLVIDIVCKALNMNDKVMKEQAKLIDELRAALASKSATAGIETKQGDTDDDDDGYDDDDRDDNDDGDEDANYKVLHKNRYRKPKIVLPPEYNENNTRWSLKHHILEPGLVELMPQTSVYINAVELNHCKRLAKTCRGLARMLLLEIFTKSALSVCSLTGSRARAYDRHGAFIRPGLDAIAINAILNFVEEYRRARGWKAQKYQSTLIKNSIRNLMKMIRVKYGA